MMKLAIAIALLAASCSFSVDPMIEESPDAAIASPVYATLRQTSDGVIAPGIGVSCDGTQGTTRDQSWARVFELDRDADPALREASSFALTDVAIRVSHAAHASAVLVRIGRYAGAYGAAVLDMSAVTWTASTTIQVPDAGGPYGVSVGGMTSQPVATFAAGDRFVVEVSTPAIASGDLRLGFTNAGEIAPSYFGSTACAVAPPRSTESMGESGHLVLEVGGWAQP